MSNVYDDAFRAHRPGKPFGTQGDIPSISDAVEQFRAQFQQRGPGGPRASKGDVRLAVLSLLTEGPKHGYQLIAEIEQRSGGTWRPSPGSVYPTLQLLADEGLVTAEESAGRKTYALTEAGRAVAADEASNGSPWAAPGEREQRRFGALPKAGVELAQAAAQVHRSGSAEQVQEAVEILDDARRRLYSILAQR